MTEKDFITYLFSDSTMYVSIITNVVMILCFWRLFTKARKPGWASIIPFYSTYMQFEAFWDGNGWKFLLLLIPLANFIIYIQLCIKTAKSFGKSGGFGVGLLFLPIIFYPILAFGNSEYIGPNGQRIPFADELSGEAIYVDDSDNNENNSNSYNKNENNDKNTSHFALIIILIIAIVAVLAIGLFAISNKSKDASVSHEDKTSETISGKEKDDKKINTTESADTDDNSLINDSSSNDSTDESDTLGSSAEIKDFSDEDLTGYTYQSIYDEYEEKINAEGSKMLSEFENESVGMSDDEKYDLASKKSEQIYNIESEGDNKIIEYSIQINDNSDEYLNWTSKLSDLTSEQTQKIYELIG